MKRVGVDVGGTFTDLIEVDDGSGRVLVHKTFALADAREAMATMERREHFGKIVLKP